MMMELLPFMLVLARTVPVVEFTPFLGTEAVPRTVRLALAVGLAAVLAPVVPIDDVPTALTTSAWLFVVEACIGLALGFLGGLVFEAAQMAGALVDRSAYGRSGNGPFERGYGLLAIVVFLSIGGHHAWLEAIAASYTAFPMGDASLSETSVLLHIGRAAASAIGLAVLLAMPALATSLLVEVVSTVAKRSATRLGPWMTAVPTRAVTIIGVTSLGLGVFAEAFAAAARDAMTALGAF